MSLRKSKRVLCFSHTFPFKISLTLIFQVKITPIIVITKITIMASQKKNRSQILLDFSSTYTQINRSKTKLKFFFFHDSPQKIIVFFTWLYFLFFFNLFNHYFRYFFSSFFILSSSNKKI